MKQLEHRSAQLVEVNYPQRMIELVVMPYEQEATVEYQGRFIKEICSRGAYDGIQRRPGRVTVNRDHDDTKYCGRAVTFHPSREEGLVAEVHIHRTALGDETLAMAEDDDLAASATFASLADRWTDRNTRRLEKCWLASIAMVPEPAYAGAKVLAMRSAAERHPANPGPSVATPNLDELRLWQLQQSYEHLTKPLQ